HYVSLLVLHSFPTRRSSDLAPRIRSRGRHGRRRVGRCGCLPAKRDRATAGTGGDPCGRRGLLGRVPADEEEIGGGGPVRSRAQTDRKSTRLNSSHLVISYAV